jgi:hypothetical protein
LIVPNARLICAPPQPLSTKLRSSFLALFPRKPPVPLNGLGFQNLVTLPGLRKHADQPQILAMTTLHGATRGGSPAVITASPTIGVGLAVDLSQEPGSAPVTAYVFDLIDAQGKQVWEGEVAAATSSQNASQRVSIGLPGPMLRNGVYTLVVSGAEAQGARTSLDRYSFNIALTK